MINKTNSRFTKQGLSLLEVMISMFLGALLINTLLTIQNVLSTAQKTLTTDTIAVTDANAAIQSMSREIRNAKQAANGSYPMELADDYEIIFYGNIDQDQDIEKIRYYIYGDSLNRGVVEPSGNPPIYSGEEKITLVIPNVIRDGRPILTYFNGEWPTDTVNNPLPAPARLMETKYVTVSITINPNPQTPTTNYYLETSAQIRSVKNN